MSDQCSKLREMAVEEATGDVDTSKPMNWQSMLSISMVNHKSMQEALVLIDKKLSQAEKMLVEGHSDIDNLRTILSFIMQSKSQAFMSAKYDKAMNLGELQADAIRRAV